jgi:hypothetical protein
VTAHFGDPMWIKHCLSQIDQFSGDEVFGVVVIDQSKKSRKLLENLPRVTDVFLTDNNIEQMTALGHDHPSALDQCLRKYSFRTDRIVILDSDCFPIAPNWLDSRGLVRLAADPQKSGLSHPCFMDFPAELRHEINFSDGCITPGIDTGRLVAYQLTRSGHAVELLEPRVMWRGVRGHLYSESIYHHGSGSFTGHRDKRLAQQSNGRIDKILSKKVLRNNFSISPLRVFSWKIRTFLKIW